MSNVGHQLVSGAASGFASTICLQPFDFLKTRMQQGDGTLGGRRTLSTYNLTRQIIASEGVLGLWRGTTASLYRNIPGVALYMTSLTQVRTLLATSPLFALVQRPRAPGVPGAQHGSVLPSLTMQGNLMAGGTTRVVVGFLLNPFSVLKARYESNMYSYSSFPSAVMSIARGGPTELFRGFFASALRDAPYAGLFVLFYELIKRESANLLPPTSVTMSTTLHSLSAASAGAIATLATHPFDVIKTKIQVRKEERYHGLWKTSKTIWTQRGLPGFFDGSMLRLTRKTFSSAIGWAVYEGLLMLQHRRSIREQ